MSDAAVPAHPLAVAGEAVFRARLLASGLVLDAQQARAVDALARPAARGVYLWGPVGRGKSMLAERYVEAMPTRRVRRVHFHEWFRALQAEVASGVRPLERAVRRVLGSASVVLFDEFHVHDVADAIYLEATLRAILERGVFLVATSNYAPEELLPDPLHHDRFLPAIALLRERLEIVSVGDGADYRRGAQAVEYGTWRRVPVAEEPESPVELRPNGLPLRAVSERDGVGVFSFAELCDRPVGVREQLWLAERFDAVHVLAMPDPAGIRRDPLQRFASLVEILHDRGVPLHVEAGGPPEAFRGAAVPPRDLERVLSRLALLRH